MKQSCFATSSSLQMNGVCKLLKECKSAYNLGDKAQLWSHPASSSAVSEWGRRLNDTEGAGRTGSWGGGGASQLVSETQDISWLAGWRAETMGGGPGQKPPPSTPGPLSYPGQLPWAPFSVLSKGWDAGELWSQCRTKRRSILNDLEE